MRLTSLLLFFPILLLAQSPGEVGAASDQAQGVFNRLSGVESTPPDSTIEELPYFLSVECESLTDQALEDCRERAMLIAIYTEVRYPAIARENGVQGTAIIQFVIEADGSMSGFDILQNPGGGIGEEALRAIQTLGHEGPAWGPGRVNGEPTRVQFSLPVKFKIEGGEAAQRRANRQAERRARRAARGQN